MLPTQVRNLQDKADTNVHVVQEDKLEKERAEKERKLKQKQKAKDRVRSEKEKLAAEKEAAEKEARERSEQQQRFSEQQSLAARYYSLFACPHDSGNLHNEKLCSNSIECHTIAFTPTLVYMGCLF